MGSSSASRHTAAGSVLLVAQPASHKRAVLGYQKQQPVDCQQMNPDMVFNIVPDDELDAYIATRAPGLTYITDKLYAHASDYTIELDAHASIAAVNRETGLRVLVLLKYKM
eukprot:12121-Heterococcus_DN1.PRE.6